MQFLAIKGKWQDILPAKMILINLQGKLLNGESFLLNILVLNLQST